MRIKTFLTIVMLTLVSVGFIGSVWAVPGGSQRLRGLADRIFVIEGEYLFSDETVGIPPVGTKFDNCYYFNDGNWVDPLFLEGFIVPGQWIQYSNGAKTSYTATAEVDVGFVISLVQDGTVTPARGKGTPQLEAFSTVRFGDDVVAEVLSIGNEVDECPFSDLPNVPPE
jgi:hypothetical protein